MVPKVGGWVTFEGAVLGFQCGKWSDLRLLLSEIKWPFLTIIKTFHSCFVAILISIEATVVLYACVGHNHANMKCHHFFLTMQNTFPTTFLC